MQVKDIMQTNVDYVTPVTSVKEVAKLIFIHGINGVPVLDKKTIVGMVTERDILEHFYPTLEEYMEDPVHEADFEKMEDKVDEILDMPAKKIMNRRITTIGPDQPILKAQSTMFVKKVGRLPVVDKNKNLIGIVTKSDIFTAIVGHHVIKRLKKHPSRLTKRLAKKL